LLNGKKGELALAAAIMIFGVWLPLHADEFRRAEFKRSGAHHFKESFVWHGQTPPLPVTHILVEILFSDFLRGEAAPA